MKILKLALFLAIVAGLSGGALSFVYHQTSPIIQEAAIASEKENLMKIYNEGETFKVLDTNLSDYPCLQNVYDAGGKGYVYKCSVTGYSSSTPITFLIAINNDGTYKGYEVIDCSGETPNFGSKVAEEPFKSEIVGKEIGEGIDLITGATISSNAVVSAIEDATAHYENNLK